MCAFTGVDVSPQKDSNASVFLSRGTVEVCVCACVFERAGMREGVRVRGFGGGLRGGS